MQKLSCGGLPLNPSIVAHISRLRQQVISDQGHVLCDLQIQETRRPSGGAQEKVSPTRMDIIVIIIGLAVSSII